MHDTAWPVLPPSVQAVIDYASHLAYLMRLRQDWGAYHQTRKLTARILTGRIACDIGVDAHT
jgi:hypothetical protein